MLGCTVAKEMVVKDLQCPLGICCWSVGGSGVGRCVGSWSLSSVEV
jgi:hypothetical protein